MMLKAFIIFIGVSMSDSQQFQCADKDEMTQMVKVHFTHGSKQTKQKVYEPKLSLKLDNKSNQIQKTVKKKFQPKNISFEAQYYEETEQSGSDEDYHEQQSSLVSHYRAYDQMYCRKRSFGTNWIGYKQYFASIFFNPDRISKSNLDRLTLFPDQEPQTSEKCAFDSQFQSGNLFAVYKIGEHEYDLILQNDVNTKGNTQWFYFRITNPPPKTNIKINIVNFRKPDSLFNYGMQPCYHSAETEKKTGQGWVRKGANVQYFRNEHEIQNSRRFYSTLTFTISTPFKSDVLKIAQCYPYTVTDLNCYLQNLSKINYKKELVSRQTIVNTVGKNKVQAITIKEFNKAKSGERPLIVIMARQHPGETPGSFVCEGLLDYFLSKDKESQFLRKNYEIKVIPMLNPDGVVVGNYRTNLSGFDLNRCWDTSEKSRNPQESSYIKSYLASLFKGRTVSMILDLHGHSRKLFSFFYGNPWPSSAKEVRGFPFLASKLAPYHIRFEDCTFAAEEFKRQTARIQLGNLAKIPNIFTFETSFFGHITKEREKKHFTMESYRQLGFALGRALYVNEKSKTNNEGKEYQFYKKCLGELQSNPGLIKAGDKINSGSDSNPQECELKSRDTDRLKKSEEYDKELKVAPKSMKIAKKMLRNNLGKQFLKETKKLQVMDIARVNSIFPNDILALVPSSFILRKKNKMHKQVQTQDFPLIKIYQACKIQDQTTQSNQSCFTSQTLQSNQFQSNMMIQSNQGSREYALKAEKILPKKNTECVDSNLLRTNSRPYTSKINHFSLPNRNSQFREAKTITKHRKEGGIEGMNKKVKVNQSIQTNISLYVRNQSLITFKESVPQASDEMFSTIQTNHNRTRQNHTRNYSRTRNSSSVRQTWRITKKSVL